MTLHVMLQNPKSKAATTHNDRMATVLMNVNLTHDEHGEVVISVHAR